VSAAEVKDAIQPKTKHTTKQKEFYMSKSVKNIKFKTLITKRKPSEVVVILLDTVATPLLELVPLLGLVVIELTTEVIVDARLVLARTLEPELELELTLKPALELITLVETALDTPAVEETLTTDEDEETPVREQSSTKPNEYLPYCTESQSGIVFELQ